MKRELDFEEQKRKRIKPWLVIFLIFLGMIIGLTSLVLFRVGSQREGEVLQKTKVEKSSKATFQVQLTKQQTNELINYYLNEYQKDSKVKYNFVLENQAMLQGTFPFLGHDLNFYLYFEPYVLQNGDVQLKAKSISIGTLSLPISELMKYVKSKFKLPEWVEVNTKEEQIIMHLSKFQLKGGMYIGAEKIDLVGDEIRFNVFLPVSQQQGK